VTTGQLKRLEQKKAYIFPDFPVLPLFLSSALCWEQVQWTAKFAACGAKTTHTDTLHKTDPRRGCRLPSSHVEAFLWCTEGLLIPPSPHSSWTSSNKTDIHSFAILAINFLTSPSPVPLGKNKA
jgi:hypothetical protein